MKKLAFLFFVLTSTEVSALEWIFVGAGYYVDKDGAERRGDLATIYARHESGKSTLDGGVVTFDCKRKIAFGYGLSEAKGYSDGEPLGLAAAIACRPKWQFWK